MLLDGRQVSTHSVPLDRFNLSGLQGSITYATGSIIGSYQSPLQPTDFVNKLYVDSIVAAVGATNGLTEITPGIISLGGTMSMNTLLDFGSQSYDMTFKDVSYFHIQNSDVFDIESSFISLDSGIGSIQFQAGDDITLYSFNGQVSIEGTSSVFISSNNSIELTFASGSITDTSGASQGIVYSSDYTMGFVTNSLVTKGYVDIVSSSTSISSTSDKNILILSTYSIDMSATGVLISNIPKGYVEVVVNGQVQKVGNGVTSSVDCYFSSDSGSTSLPFSSIVSGSELIWNGITSGFILEPGDYISLLYSV